ncbi:LexA family protein [Xanthomarina sp. F2636L]|uniref:LexA family protein n=1 Tax=Xanthomarina sp. F2636L TaxID=2996018 RepID=UPI00225E2A51|nr:S24 family peptidase [Xanthomarina sp. F2636L]MCX7552123.1 hypothetical protein [Xanthomarina sp. F2636L]
MNGISAGFTPPADDFLDLTVDLNKLLIKNPNTTFYHRIKGDSIIDAGIYDVDLLLVDKSLETRKSRIVVFLIKVFGKDNFLMMK